MSVALFAPAAVCRRASAAESSCVLAARASGDPQVVAHVVPLLVERGVPVSGAARCGAIFAVLAADGIRVRVTITLEDGRTVERIADDVVGAATTIESWSRRDVSDPLLAARAAQPYPIRGAPMVTATRGWRGQIVGAFDASASGDGALWTGGRVQGCARIGAFCLGALVMFSKDTEGSGDSADFDTSRWMLDLMLAADVPFSMGRFSLSPGIAVGETALHLERGDPNPDRETMTDLRLRAYLAAGWRIAGSWSLRMDLGVAYTPFATTRILDVEDQLPPLAAAPRWQASLGIGVSYSGL